MLVILKIPVAYLGAVVWWAIRAEPAPPEGAGRLAPVLDPAPGCDWFSRRTRAPRPLPRGSRRAPRKAGVAL